MITIILAIALLVMGYKVFCYKMTAAVLMAYMEDKGLYPSDDELNKYPAQIIREKFQSSNKY